jgi:hypothetical protein
LVIFGAFSYLFCCGGFEASPLWFWLGMHAWTLRHSFPCHPSLKSVGKGAQCGGFLRFWESGALGRNPSIPLDLASFGGPNHSIGCPWGTRSIRKVLCKSMERIGRSGKLLEGLTHGSLFILSCLGLTGLTEACDQSNWC